MSESLRGLLYLNEKYGIKLDNRNVLNKGDSLFSTVINTKLNEDTKNLLSKKLALSNDRGLSAGNERAMKDIKSFNSHMPDVLRRLDWYMEEDAKVTTIPELQTEYEEDYVNEITEKGQELVTPEEKEKILKKYQKQEKEEMKEKDEEYKKKLKEYQEKLKEKKAGKMKPVFGNVEASSDADEPKKKEASSVVSNDSDADEQKEDIASSDADEEEVAPTSIVEEELEKPEREEQLKATEQQENAFKEFVGEFSDKPAKRNALIIIDKDGSILKHYKSITEFKDDKVNYKKFHTILNYVDYSRRKAGNAIIENTTGNALYFVPLNAYRDRYQTQTWLRRHKKKVKKSKEN